MLSTDNFGQNVTFVDDFTRITWFHPLYNNSYFFATFYQFEKLISKQFSNKQKCVKIDGGGEFLKMKFKDYCSVNGIIHQVSCPYTHAQKGLSLKLSLFPFVRSQVVNLFGDDMQ